MVGVARRGRRSACAVRAAAVGELDRLAGPRGRAGSIASSASARTSRRRPRRGRARSTAVGVASASRRRSTPRRRDREVRRSSVNGAASASARRLAGSSRASRHASVVAGRRRRSVRRRRRRRSTCRTTHCGTPNSAVPRAERLDVGRRRRDRGSTSRCGRRRSSSAPSGDHSGWKIDSPRAARDPARVAERAVSASRSATHSSVPSHGMSGWSQVSHASRAPSGLRRGEA